MIDREHEQLLQLLAAGEASPAERARIEAWLEHSAEGRRRRAELEALMRTLAGVKPVEAPARLHGEVMSAIARERLDRRHAKERRPWAFALPVAAALLAVAIAIPWSRHALHGPQSPDVSGSLVGGVAPIAREEWRVEGASVTVRAYAAPGGARLVLELNASQPLELQLAPQEGGAAVRLTAAAAAGVQTVAGPRSLILRAAGEHRAEVAVSAPQGGPVRIDAELRTGLGRRQATLLLPARDR